MLRGGQHFDQPLMSGPKKRFHNFDLMEKGLVGENVVYLEAAE